jgi:hypothetical protein
MRRSALGLLLILAGTAMAVVTAVLPAAAQPGRAAAAPKLAGLPNLVMHKITQVAVKPWFSLDGTPQPGRWAVRFTSVVDNTGKGPFVIKAHRAAVGQPCSAVDDDANDCESGDMTADQLVVGKRSTKRYQNVADVYFDENHYHWHLRGAERYELVTVKGRSIAQDVKTGFCFGDRLSVKYPRHYPGLQTGLSNCRYGSADPANDGRRALSLTEGISPGWSDDYRSYENGKPLEGQQLELTGLAAGRYVLINVVNPNGQFKETTRRDDASAVLFALSWPAGTAAAPRVKIVRSCVSRPACVRVGGFR